MAESEISETQFVFGYLRELFERRKSSYMTLPFGEVFTLPTTAKEKDIAADFLVKHYSHSEYYQFKRSHSLKHRRGHAEIHANVPTTFLPYYRFKIYNKMTFTKSGKVRIGQYEKLSDIAEKHPGDLVYYCAPCFHTEKEFIDLFYKNQIIDNSIRINCSQFSKSQFKPPMFDINDGEKHFLIYRIDRDSGYICSEAQEVRVESVARLVIDVPKPTGFIEHLDAYYRELLSEEIIEGDVGNNFAQNSRVDILEATQALQNYLLTTHGIFWIPLFKRENG